RRDRRGRGIAPDRRRPHAVRAADAPQSAALRRADRGRHLRHSWRHRRGAGHSRLPVYRESLDEVIGMVHIKDVFVAKVDEIRDRSLSALMREPLFVPESMGVIELLARMRAERVHLAIVVDEFGGTEGL